ncbi:hypothetical protein GCM10009576_033780 [Streptomyces rhizosphaericus]|uniref:Uncharacterized protein n=1 Tax=Streptomyces rhizosphaericus TaxID=114699 RepID=A0ABP4CRH9_9ACTN
MRLRRVGGAGEERLSVLRTCPELPSFVRGAVVAGRAHAAEPHIDTAPRPFGAPPGGSRSAVPGVAGPCGLVGGRSDCVGYARVSLVGSAPVTRVLRAASRVGPRYQSPVWSRL